VAHKVFETSRLPYFLDNRLTDGGEVVSLTRRPPGKIPGTDFYYRLSRPEGHNAVGRIRSIKKCNDLIGNRTGDLQLIALPQPTTLMRAPYVSEGSKSTSKIPVQFIFVVKRRQAIGVTSSNSTALMSVEKLKG
jgi:hypothetical protein